MPELFTQSPIASARELAAREPSMEIASDTEYVDIDLLREFGRIGAGLEDRNRLQIVGVTLQFALQYVADGMMVMGMVTRHRFEIGQRRRLWRIGLEGFRSLCRVLGG